MCVVTKSSGIPVAAACAASGSIHSPAAVDGPPTRSRGSTPLIASAASSYRRRYSSRVPGQNTSRFGSFHTSNDHCATSSMPYRPTRWAASSLTSSRHWDQSLGGEMMPP